MRKLLRFAPALLAGLLILSACSDDDDPVTPVAATVPTYTLTFTGSGYTPHVNQTLTAAAVTSAGTVVFPRGTTTVAADGTFSLTLANVLATGATYNLDYWIDSNFVGGTAGTCDPPAIDHQWRIAVNGGSAVTANVNVNETHNTNFTGVCASFTESATPSAPGGTTGPTMPGPY